MNAANNVLTFLLHTLFSLYIGAILLRIILSATRADFYNPISQFLVTITNPVLVPLRRVFPSIGNIDTASWVAIFTLKAIEIILLLSIRGASIQPAGVVVLTILGVITAIVTIFLYAIIIRAVLSWFGGAYQQQNPMLSLLNSITEPILRPVRRLIPPIGMFDLSAFVVILGLYSILIILKSF